MRTMLVTAFLGMHLNIMLIIPSPTFVMHHAACSHHQLADILLHSLPLAHTHKPPRSCQLSAPPLSPAAVHHQQRPSPHASSLSALFNASRPPGLGTPQDPRLREAAALLQQGLNATEVAEEEAIWTQIIDQYEGVDANWAPDVVGRAYGNRGNARSRRVHPPPFRSCLHIRPPPNTLIVHPPPSHNCSCLDMTSVIRITR